jgi:hypothetical protein
VAVVEAEAVAGGDAEPGGDVRWGIGKSGPPPAMPGTKGL